MPPPPLRKGKRQSTTARPLSPDNFVKFLRAEVPKDRRIFKWRYLIGAVVLGSLTSLGFGGMVGWHWLGALVLFMGRNQFYGFRASLRLNQVLGKDNLRSSIRPLVLKAIELESMMDRTKSNLQDYYRRSLLPAPNAPKSTSGDRSNPLEGLQKMVYGQLHESMGRVFGDPTSITGSTPKTPAADPELDIKFKIRARMSEVVQSSSALLFRIDQGLKSAVVKRGEEGSLTGLFAEADALCSFDEKREFQEFFTKHGYVYDSGE